MMQIAIIGGGKMGTAFCRALITLSDTRISVCDHHEEKLRTLGVEHCSKNPKDIVPDADIVILAVKPQSFDALTQELGSSLKDKLILSIMAGIPCERLMKQTHSECVIRSLPNLAVSVGLGVTTWIATKAVDARQRKTVQQLLGAMGIAIELQDEAMFDAATLPGCGPAFFFHLVALMEQKATQLGFSPPEAASIARQVFLGSAELLKTGTTKPEEWVKAVASKGGATEAGLNVLADKHFDAIFFEAIDAAVKRCRELGK